LADVEVDNGFIR